jgi:hypothetical protein
VEVEVFPLLIKLIDARETLSVQVHPDNDVGGALRRRTEDGDVVRAGGGAGRVRVLRAEAGRDARPV